MEESILSNRSFQELIKKLKINPQQERFLLDELSKMDGKERLELLDMLIKVYELNQEEAESIEKLRNNL